MDVLSSAILRDAEDIGNLLQNRIKSGEGVSIGRAAKIFA